jgi:hypothetical protein
MFVAVVREARNEGDTADASGGGRPSSAFFFIGL